MVRMDGMRGDEMSWRDGRCDEMRRLSGVRWDEMR